MRMARLHTGRHKVLAAYRSYHGATAGSIALTGDPRRWPSEPGDARGRAVLGARTPTGRRSTPTTEAEECERALAHLRRGADVRGRRTRSPRSSLEPVVGTNGILVPPRRLPRGRARDLRRARHRDDRRRGDGRLRPVRRVVRGRPVGRGARPHHVREGRQLRLRPARRRDHLAAIAATFAERAVPRRSHLLRAPARLRVGGRVDRDLRRRGHPRARPATSASDVIGPRLASSRDAAPVGRRGPRPRRVLGDRAGPRPGDPRAAGAVQRVAARTRSRWPSSSPRCKARGVWPFTHFNRVHVVPPLVVTEEELLQGIDAIDDALDAADAYVA